MTRWCKEVHFPRPPQLFVNLNHSNFPGACGWHLEQRNRLNQFATEHLRLNPYTLKACFTPSRSAS